jgi:hypothetical protein
MTSPLAVMPVKVLKLKVKKLIFLFSRNSLFSIPLKTEGLTF